MEILKLYEDFLDSEKLHVTLGSVLDADRELSDAMTALDGVEMLNADMAVGKAIREYEKQGFVYGFNMARYMMKLLTDRNDGKMTLNGESNE